MSNMFLLKTNIFEVQSGVENLFCRTTRSRPSSFSMYCSFFNNSFLWCTFKFLCSNFCFGFWFLVFNIQPLLQKLVSFLTHGFLDTKHQHFSHARLCPSKSFSFSYHSIFSASTLTLACVPSILKLVLFSPIFWLINSWTESFILLACRLLSLRRFLTLSSI